MRRAAGHDGSPRAFASAAFPLGAHLVTRRFGYTHHGIYVGAGWVVHYAGLSRITNRGPVEEVSLDAFAAGRSVSIRDESSARYSAETIAVRARSRLGENRYAMVTNNCEHFCAWCLHGESRSEQVERIFALPRAFVATIVRARRLMRRKPAASGAACTEDVLASA
jgi:hypothetical protein